MEAARRKRRGTRFILTGIAAVARDLAEFVVWWYVVPVAGAFVLLVVLEPDLFSFSLAFVFGVAMVIVVAVFVVLLTTTLGYLRAKRAAIERQIRDGEDHSAENRSR